MEASHWGQNCLTFPPRALPNWMRVHTARQATPDEFASAFARGGRVRRGAVELCEAGHGAGASDVADLDDDLRRSAWRDADHVGERRLGLGDQSREFRGGRLVLVENVSEHRDAVFAEAKPQNNNRVGHVGDARFVSEFTRARTVLVVGSWQQWDRTAFLAFVRYLRSLHPPDTKIAVVLDNFSSHLSTKIDQRVGEWAKANNVELAYTATYSSWLNRQSKPSSRRCATSRSTALTTAPTPSKPQ
jgi:hypothetical protein